MGTFVTNLRVKVRGNMEAKLRVGIFLYVGLLCSLSYAHSFTRCVRLTWR